MDEHTQSTNNGLSKKLRVIIIVLLVLLLLSAGALAARVVYLNYFADNSTTVIVPDNLIGKEESTPTETLQPTDPEPSVQETTAPTAETTVPAEAPVTSSPAPEETTVPTTSATSNGGQTEKKAATISLYQGKPGDNEKFQVNNMFPGDTVTQYFCVKVSHDGDIILTFDAEVTEQTKNLGDVLMIRVTHLDTGKVLYDGAFNDMNIAGYKESLPAVSNKETIAYYEVVVSLPTSVGNEYQAAMLLADLQWYVEDDEHLTPPQTGDNSNLELWFGLMVVSGIGLLILLLTKKREEEEYATEQ